MHVSKNLTLASITCSFLSKTLVLAFLLTLYQIGYAQSVFDSLYDVKQLEIHFASGKAELDRMALKALDSILTTIPGDKTFRVTAHTDAVGSEAFNKQLSQQRAEAVTRWLNGKGVPEASIIAVYALGEKAPKTSNQTETGRALNRRAIVEIARKVPMALLEGQVTDKRNGQGIQTTVTFQSKIRKDSVRTDSLGWYRVNLPKDSIVKIEVVEKNYFFESVTLKVMGSPELYKKYKISPNIVLPPAEPGETVILRNLYFVGNQAKLLPVSEPELPKILRFMQLNPDLVIEIGGHVNRPYDKNHKYPLKPGQTPAQYMMTKEDPALRTLSTDRANTVRDYLLKNGIEAGRISAKGYENSKMLHPYTGSTEEQQQMNRRVEITVTGRTGH
ncbi:MAG TPA: OmpA family protein [Saprospiraceae bacterium]|nr:OmpA family protein [Saprospiraceae bacterium]